MVNYALWLPYLGGRIVGQVQNDDDLHGGQWSNGIKCSKLCSVATNLVRRSLMTMMTFIEVKGQQMSNVVIYVIWLPHLARCTANKCISQG